MMDNKIAINGFFGRMGQAIYELSLKQNFDVTVGVDLKEKLSSNLDLKFSDNLSEHSNLFDVVIDFSLPEPCVKAVKECQKLNKPITIGTTGFSAEQKKYLWKLGRKYLYC